MAGRHQHSDDAALFCPHCSAPQLLLPEHMRLDDPVGAAGSTTGTLPPPRVADSRGVDWRMALPGAAVVAVVGALLTVAGLKFDGVALLSFCWLMSGAVIAVGLYSRRRPRVWVDARVGLRIGVVTGLLMLGAMAVAGAGAGVVMRFVTHGMEAFDRQGVEQAKQAQVWALRWLQGQNQDKEVQERYVAFMNSPAMTSPEMRAGTELAQLGFEGALLLLISAGSAAFSGMLQGRRRSALRGE